MCLPDYCGQIVAHPSVTLLSPRFPYRTTLSKIILASDTLSTMTEVSLGDGLLMSTSLARRTAAMIDVEITSVDANLSCF
jgi:hypothetical protein